jgi:hypothetical protein
MSSLQAKRPTASITNPLTASTNATTNIQRSTSSLNRSNTAVTAAAQEQPTITRQTPSSQKSIMKMHQTVIDGPANIFKGHNLEDHKISTIT